MYIDFAYIYKTLRQHLHFIAEAYSCLSVPLKSDPAESVMSWPSESNCTFDPCQLAVPLEASEDTCQPPNYFANMPILIAVAGGSNSSCCWW